MNQELKSDISSGRAGRATGYDTYAGFAQSLLPCLLRSVRVRGVSLRSSVQSTVLNTALNTVLNTAQYADVHNASPLVTSFVTEVCE
jgi:hypothetical protein